MKLAWRQDEDAHWRTEVGPRWYDTFGSDGCWAVCWIDTETMNDWRVAGPFDSLGDAQAAVQRYEDQIAV
jgi:hypothetical protein